MPIYNLLSTNSISCHTSNTIPEITQSDGDKNIKEEIREMNTNNTNRNAILCLTIDNPDIRNREVRLTDLSNGALDYYLKKIEKSKPILVVRPKKKPTRYYSNNIPYEEVLIIGQTIYPRLRILAFILKHKVHTFYSIVEHTNKAPSTNALASKGTLRIKNIIRFCFR